MNLTVAAREVLNGIHEILYTVLNQMAQRINSWAAKEHNTDGTHTAITATTISGTTVTLTGLAFNGTTQTTVGATGGATALPATPTGYIVFTIGTTEYVVPYYAKA